MNMLKAGGVLAWLLIGDASAQRLESVVGPPIAPVGCPIEIALSNDGAAFFDFYSTDYIVRNASGRVVFEQHCGACGIFIAPGSTVSWQWNQRDRNNVPVPPGIYFVHVPLSKTGSPHRIEISASSVAGLAAIGVPRIGTNRSYYLCAPGLGGKDYILAASLSSSQGFPTCGGRVPLNVDALFGISLSTPNVFSGFGGKMDSAGVSRQPSIAIPSSSVLVGSMFNLAFVLVDRRLACPVASVSSVLPVRIR